MLIAVCNCVRCAVCGMRHFNSCSVSRCVQQCLAVCAGVQQCCSVPQCVVVPQCCSVRQCARMSAAMHAHVCGSAPACVRQCARCCVAVVLAAVGGCSAECGSVRQSAAVCGSVRQCAAVCGCLAVQQCAAVRQCAYFQINSKYIHMNSSKVGII
jgi:hypothetical protein